MKTGNQIFKKLKKSFYLRSTLTVAKDLLGKYIVRNFGKKMMAGMIVETEAYLGEKDPASHAYHGITKRNEVMFYEGGHLYVYFTYGMHFCANVVTERSGKGRAVLIRAVEPVEGIEFMMKNRKTRNDINLTNGPAKFCEAFGINRSHNGIDLLGDEIFITQGREINKSQIISTKRIGIKNGVEKQWRFYIKGNIFVSKTKKPR